MDPNIPKTHVRFCRYKPTPCSCPLPITTEYSKRRVLIKRVKPRSSLRSYLPPRYQGLVAKLHPAKNADTKPTMLTQSLQLFSRQFRLLTPVPTDILPFLQNEEVAKRSSEAGEDSSDDSDTTASRVKLLKRNIILHDIPSVITPGHLLAMFGRYGAIIAANIAIDNDTEYDPICTSAYITFLREASAMRVWNTYQARGFKIFKMKCLMVEPVDDQWASLRPSEPGVGYFTYDWEEEGFVPCERPIAKKSNTASASK